jgi:hypothetical protein
MNGEKSLTFMKGILKHFSRKTSSEKIATVDASVKLIPGGDEVIPMSSGVYRRYTAPDKKTAIEFLEKQNVSAPSYFVVVETPEGTVAKDISGIFGN